MITKYGFLTAGIFILISVVIFIAAQFIGLGWIKYSTSALSILLFLFTVYFFRDPERTIPLKDNIIVSPADGKVLLIKKIKGNDFIEGEAWQISIFMSPLNVHVNRIPIDGTVKHIRYIDGEYLMAFHDKADERNERAEFVIESRFGNVFFTQVAGFIARRIVYDLCENDSVKIGDRFGMIKFGSRVDVIVSSEWQINVKENDLVTAGESILFEHKND